MATLILLRHAQASLGHKNYDQLSDIGHLQASRLGDYFSQIGFKPARCLSGTLQRHIETSNAVMGSLTNETPLETDALWNEFDFKDLIKAYLRCYPDPTINLSSFSDAKIYFKILKKAMLTWSQGKLENLDSKYQLRCAAAISPYDFGRAEALINAGVDAIVIDTAHGHSKGVIDTVKELKSGMGSSIDVIAGNVGTAVGAKALADAGADAVKVGIGPGSICTTRVVCGVGIPQITAVHEASRAVPSDVPIIADGGIKQSGDVPKAITAGASSVMMGGLLAATEESPGEKIMMQGRRFVVYRGMGSLEAMKSGKGSRERYSQGDVEDSSQLIPQGVEGRVPYRGTAGSVLHQFAGSLKFSLGYCGARTVPDLQRRGILYRVTPSGLREAHPHDIQMVKDAPNYRTV